MWRPARHTRPIRASLRPALFAAMLVLSSMPASAQPAGAPKPATELMLHEMAEREPRPSSAPPALVQRAIAARAAAVQLEGIGRYREAAGAWSIAVPLLRKVSGPDHPETLQAIDHWAHTLQEEYQTEAAIPLLQEVADRFANRYGADHKEMLRLLGNFGEGLKRGRRYPACANVFARQAEIAQARPAVAEQRLRMAWRDQAFCLSWGGRNAEARRLYLQVNDITPGASSLDQRQRDTILHEIAGTLANERRYAESAEILEELLRTKRADERRSTATTSTNLAESLMRLPGREVEAVTAARRSVELAEAESTADILGIKADPLNRYSSSNTGRDLAYSYSILGRVLEAVGDHAGSANAHRKSLSAAEGTDGHESMTAAIASLNLAGAESALGDRAGGAARAATAARRIAAIQEPEPEFSRAAHALAASYNYRAGDAQTAMRLLESGCTDPGRRTNPAGPRELMEFGSSEALCGLWYALSLHLADARRSSGKVRQQAFTHAQLAIASSAQAALNRAAARSAGAEGMAAEFEALLDERAQVDRAILEASRPNAPAGLESPRVLLARLQAIDARRAQLEAAISRADPAYWDLRSPQPVALVALQARSGSDARLLKDDEALVLWMVAPGKDRGLVFAVSKAGSAWAEITMTGDEVAARVKALRAQIDPCGYGVGAGDCDQRGRGFDRASAYALHQALLGQPQIQAILSPETVRTLLIVPSGPLTALPPAVLVTAAPQGGKAGDESAPHLRATAWLIRDKALAVLPSVAALRTLRVVLPDAAAKAPSPANQDRDGLFMMADPDFAGRGSAAGACTRETLAPPGGAQRYYRDDTAVREALAKLRPLPCTRLEAQALQKALGGEPLLGRDAREASLRNPTHRERLARARVVAFATHGLISGDFGLGEPALALAAPLPSEIGDDGLLTASEAASLRLSADWVLLSACNTASPDAPEAHGLSGLSRAFFYAGARSLLVSHWRVDESATEALITRTIALHADGVPKAQALRDATLALLRGDIGPGDDSAAQPAAWAPFSLIGDPR
jgi:CHAT domain-containing protein